MEWEGREGSENIEDRRGLSPGVMIGGGGSILLIILALALGVDPRQFMGNRGGGGGEANTAANRPVDEDRYAKFTSVILKDTELVWDEQFKNMGKRYAQPKLVLFTNQVESACGRAGAEVGPFYCPGDSKIYIDLTFYDVLDRQLGAGGEFARAYVIAHEVGHHVQRLLGYSARVDEARRTRARDANQMSVRLELQADYLAGVWAHHAQRRFKYLNAKDIQSATNAAFRIGDDVLQKRARGKVTPDAFTHGSAAQRQRWFLQGYQSGDVEKASLLFSLPYEKL